MRTIELRLASGPRAPRVARRALQELRGDVPPQRLFDAGLLVSELVTNSVRYAPGSMIDVRFDLDDAYLRVEVRDNGPGIAGDRTFATMPAPGVGRGRGLALVAAVAESWGIGPGPGARVWFRMDLPGRNGNGGVPPSGDVPPAAPG